MFARMADFITRHAKAMAVLWLVLLVCSLPFAMKSGDVLEYDMTNMSGAETESNNGQGILDDHFVQMSMDEILVVSYADAAEKAAIYNGSDPGSQSTFFGRFSRLLNEEFGSKIVATYGGNYQKAPGTDKAGVMLVALSAAEDGYDITHKTGDIRHLVSDAKRDLGMSNRTYVTGDAAISYDTEKSSMEDVSKVDPLSIALIFILLALFFYAIVTAFVPPAVVGMAYGIVLTLIWAIGQFLGIYYITKTLLLVVMLGAGCDYSLFILTRYRNERKRGRDHDAAIREAVMWGGEAVFTSGVSVMIGFAALTLCSFSLVQTLGLCLALGILVALLAALTFIPSLIYIVGDRIYWPSNIERYKKADASASSGNRKGAHAHLVSIGKRYFGWLSRNTHKYAKLLVALFVVLCIPTTYYFATSEDSSDTISVMPDSESIDGLNLIMTQTDGGTIMPTYVVMEMRESLVERAGTFALAGANVPYIRYTAASISVTGSAPSAQISGTLYELSHLELAGGKVTHAGMAGKIEASHPEIVGSVSSATSWQLAYVQAQNAAYAKVYSTYTSQGATDEAAKAAAAAFVADPKNVNEAVYSSFLERNPVGAEIVKGVLDRVGWNGAYDQVLGVDGGVPVTLQNMMDYQLNVRTGLLSTNGAYVCMTVVTTEKPMSDNTMDFVADIRDDLKNGGELYGTFFTDDVKETYVSGTSAQMSDISGIVEEQFSFIRLVVIVLLIVLLFFILGCYLTPIRAIITIVMSVIWTVALTRLVFDSLLGTPVLWLIPIVLFVVLLGLGMDYEIFLTTKIRENRIKGMENGTAIDEAVKQAGGVISLCALIMGGTFLTLLLAGSSMLQEFGFALGVGILIDGLFMVGFVSPSLMHLMGEWSWKGPRFLQKRHAVPERDPDPPAED